MYILYNQLPLHVCALWKKNKYSFFLSFLLSQKRSQMLPMYRDCIQRKHGVWDPMLELTITHLISSQLCSQLSTPTTKRKGWSGEDLSYWYKHVCICLLISKAVFLCKHKYREGGGKGVRAELNVCL